MAVLFHERWVSSMGLLPGQLLWLADVPLDLQKYQYVVQAVQFFPCSKAQFSWYCCMCMSKLAVELCSLNMKTTAVNFH